MKRSRWSVGRQLGLSWTLAILVVGGFIALAITSTRDFMLASRLTHHTHEVLGVLDGIVSSAQDVEVGYRGFLLTGEESYLEPFADAQARLTGDLKHLSQLVSDNPGQQQRAKVLGAAVIDRMNNLAMGVNARREQGSDVTRNAILATQGRGMLLSLRKAAADMRQEENRLLELRTRKLEGYADQVKAVFLGGGAVAFILFVSIAVAVGRSLTRNIGEAVTQVQSSSSELQTAASQQAVGAREQASSTTEISTTVKELLATSRQIATSAQQVARVADETAGAAHSGTDTVQRAQEAIDAVSRQVDAVVNHMLELGKRSQEIGGILDIINELAEQTNILAINATIESAGAGEHGRRFAVVAEEIRKLADRVGVATKDIRVLIDEIRAASNTTIMATEDGSKAVQGSTQQFSEVAGSFRRIAELVRSNLDVAREIEMSTQQQTTAVEQVNTAILEVAETARQSEASSDLTLRTATRLIQLSQQLNALIDSRLSA
jgi:methyl-accepting chemotaxis protein